MKRETKNIYTVFLRVFVLVITVNLYSCDGLLDVDQPKSLVSRDVVFQDDVTATSAVTGMYATIMANTTNFASGSNYGLSALTSLSADDYANYLETNLEYIQFFQNSLRSDNALISNLWTTPYQIIYQANSAIESLKSSTQITDKTRNQLMGEALFMRAFCHFNLVNMFGEIPIATSTDYTVNNNSTRASVDLVYEKIIEDLLEAQMLLSDSYPTSDRVRPNRATATALLARAYLYISDWEDAEIQASSLITNAGYSLEENLNNVFLSTSKEAIWQLRPTTRTANTWDGYYFVLINVPNYAYINNDLIAAFEDGDSRLTSWTRSIEVEGNIFNFQYKYKIRRGGPGSATPVDLTEYSMVFRLAEQYLIRAEARLKLGNLTEAIEDLDTIRGRANLTLIGESNPSIGETELLAAIVHERRSELFAEWGHRWFDLKRLNLASEFLGTTKPNWSLNDLLYPIPANEFRNNPKLGLQNTGY